MTFHIASNHVVVMSEIRVTYLLTYLLSYLLTYLLTIPDVESSHAPFGDPLFYPTFFSND